MNTGPRGGKRRYRFGPRTRVCLPALVFSAFLAACSETEREEEATAPPPVSGQVTDSAGVEIVRNGVAGIWGTEEREVEEVLRIGVVEGAEPYQFFDVSAVAVDEAGRIYVANRMTASVRVFDPRGRFLRELGGKGQGPGEFQDVSRLYVTPDGVWVRDDRQLRVTGFSYEGELLDTWTFIHDGVISLYHEAPQGWLGLELRADEPRPVRPPPRTSHVSWLPNAKMGVCRLPAVKRSYRHII